MMVLLPLTCFHFPASTPVYTRAWESLPGMCSLCVPLYPVIVVATEWYSFAEEHTSMLCHEEH